MLYNNIQSKSDGTFIVDFNGSPFHVTPEYPRLEQYGQALTYAAIKAHALAHPEDVRQYVEPVFESPKISEEEGAAMQIRALEIEAQSLVPSIQAGIDAESNSQKLVDIMLQIETLKGNI